jgi:hypothetical protein
MFCNLFIKLTNVWFSRNVITKNHYPKITIEYPRELHQISNTILAINILSTNN